MKKHPLPQKPFGGATCTRLGLAWMRVHALRCLGVYLPLNYLKDNAITDLDSVLLDSNGGSLMVLLGHVRGGEILLNEVAMNRIDIQQIPLS